MDVSVTVHQNLFRCPKSAPLLPSPLLSESATDEETDADVDVFMQPSQVLKDNQVR